MKIKPDPVLLAVLAGLLWLPHVVFADSYRCGRKVVRTGDSVSQLVQVCGEPRLKSTGSSLVEIDGVRRKVRVERWHYKRGRRSLEHVVMVYRGRVAAIEAGRR